MFGRYGLHRCRTVRKRAWPSVRLGEENAHGTIYVPGKAVCSGKSLMIVPHSGPRPAL